MIHVLMNLRAPKLTEEQIYSTFGLEGPANQHDDVARRLVEVVQDAIQKAYVLGHKVARDAAVEVYSDQAEDQDLFQDFLRHWMDTGGFVRPTYDQVDGWAPNTDATTTVWSHLCKLGIAFDADQETSDFVEVSLPSGPTLSLSRHDAETLLFAIGRRLGGGDGR